MSRYSNWNLYLVTDRKLARGRDLCEVVREAIKGGVSAVQLREKKCSSKEFLELALKLKVVTRNAGIPLIINDRIDIALAAEADGVHLGQDDLPYLKARKILGPSALIGISVTNTEQAKAAADWDVDYLGIGPIFFTNTKEDCKSPIGYDGLKKISEVSSHNLIAIGGIKFDGVAPAIAAGACGVSVVSAIMAADNPQEAAKQIYQEVLSAKNQTKLL